MRNFDAVKVKGLKTFFLTSENLFFLGGFMKVELLQPLLVTLRVIPVCETVSPIRCFSYVFKMAVALLKSKYGKKTGMPPPRPT